LTGVLRNGTHFSPLLHAVEAVLLLQIVNSSLGHAPIVQRVPPALYATRPLHPLELGNLPILSFLLASSMDGFRKRQHDSPLPHASWFEHCHELARLVLVGAGHWEPTRAA